MLSICQQHLLYASIFESQHGTNDQVKKCFSQDERDHILFYDHMSKYCIGQKQQLLTLGL